MFQSLNLETYDLRCRGTRWSPACYSGSRSSGYGSCYRAFEEQGISHGNHLEQG